jgi:hypothetical protein
MAVAATASVTTASDLIRFLSIAFSSLVDE